MAIIDRCESAVQSDFFLLAPVWAREDIARGIDHGRDTPLPPYAVERLTKALSEVSKANAKGKRDFAEAQRMPRAHRKGVLI